MNSEAKQQAFHLAVESNDSGAVATPARKPWKTPHMIVASTEENTDGLVNVGVDGASHS